MVQNSISNVLEDVVKVTANNMQLYTAIHEAIFSNQPSVKTQVYLKNGEARDIEIPCLGYMKSRVDRIDSTLSMLTNATGNSIVRMSDGSYRKLYINRLDIPRNTEFVKNNISYNKMDSIINMMEHNISIDIPIKLYNNEDTVELNIFAYKDTNSEFTHISNIDKAKTPSELKQAFEELKENNAIRNYYNFTISKQIEPTDMTAYGGVYILRVVDTESIDADDNIEHKKIYYISDIAFKGKEGSIYPISQGDVLTLYNSNGYHDTRVKVEVIDKTKSFIKVSYVDGYQPITVGSQLFPYIDENREIGIVRYSLSNRYTYFIIPTLITKSGYRHNYGDVIYVPVSNMSEFQDVTDLGKYIDKYITDPYKTRDDWDEANINEGSIKPKTDGDDSALNTSFTIIDASKDISTSSYTKITQLESQKKSVENTIEAYRDRINVLRNIISSGTSAGSAAKNELTRVTQSLEDAQNEFNTLVFNISDELSSNALDSKYEIHGIIKLNSATSKYGFECIGVDVRYRFIGSDSDVQKKEYYNLNGTNVPFNIWKYAQTQYRSRIFDDNTHEFKWDPNTTEQTSIIIPIENRYNAIIQYRYVFEAGYPENPKKSEWSNDIIVKWNPILERSSTKAIQNINQADQVKASVNNTLATNGMFRHTTDSFTAGEQYFAHSADQIASGWVTEEQVPISIYEKLKTIEEASQQLKDAFNAVDINNFEFILIDPSGNESKIQEGTNNTVRTMSYMDILKQQNSKTVSKGNEQDIDYVGVLQYTLRIQAKSKYVRFNRIKGAPEGYALYKFSTTSPFSSAPAGVVDSKSYDASGSYDPGIPMEDNCALKIGLTSSHDVINTITSSVNNSNYRYGVASNSSFATIFRDRADKLLFNMGSTLAFTDESYIDVPITLIVAPYWTSTANPPETDFATILRGPKMTSDIRLFANVGSYINSLDLTIGITFETDMR